MNDTEAEPNTGGDSACWLGRVCPDCGAVDEGPSPAPCWRCGQAAEAAR